MVLLNNNPPGIFFFCLTQQVYRQRHAGNKFLFASLLSTFLVIVFSYKLNADFLIKLGLIYSCQLIFSALAAIYAFNIYPSPNNYLILYGILFFLLCDLNIALCYLFSELSKAFNFIAWFFYLPSQFMLSLSGKSFTYPPGVRRGIKN
jgi:hypothetical protein